MNQTETATDNRPTKTTVTADCLICGATKQVIGNARTWRRWLEGEVTSDVAFRSLDSDIRRWLLNGICPDHDLEPAPMQAVK